MMEGHYFPLKMKRKDLEDVVNGDFSSSSPARKIPRLEADLLPIIEEEECEIPITVEDSLPQEQSFGNIASGGIKIEELPSVPENEERGLVLFKPMNTTPLLHSPSNFSVSISPYLISGFKNQTLWSSQSNYWRLQNDEAAAEENNCGSGDGCLAVVPWVPSQLPSADVPSQFDNYEMMDAEEEEETTMDVEESRDVQQRNDNEARGSDGLHQWQQQEHCMIPQLPLNTTTPVFWYR